ncbi:MAG: radical SAM protein [Lachnospiraceae bacterium]|nr:radical SAM protein [Lachnospiraceae bacterium]
MSHCNKKMLSFFLTTRCNLCCRYCYNAKERNAVEEKTLPFEIAKAGIDWYFEENDSRHIRFYGPGEPTQEFNQLKKITEYARSHPNGGNQVTVEIQTNGVFTEEIRDWALDNFNIMWMSFDGMKDVQSFNRPLNPLYNDLFNNRSSADVLEDNVRWLIRNKGSRNLMVGARVTITDINIDRQCEMVDYFYDLGIRYVWTNPLFYSVGKMPVCEDEQKKLSYHFNMDLYLDNYIKAYKYAKSKGVFWGSFLTINFDGESCYHCRCCTPTSAPHLTPDGYISACDMVVLGAEPYHMSPFIVGRWNPQTQIFDLYENKIKDLNNRCSTTMKHCTYCEVKYHCGGYCLGETVNETGKLDGQNLIKCAAVRRLYKELGSCDPYPYLHP